MKVTQLNPSQDLLIENFHQMMNFSFIEELDKLNYGLRWKKFRSFSGTKQNLSDNF